ITANNEAYQVKTLEEEMLLTWFEPCSKENAALFMNASQIAAKLSEINKSPLNTGNVMNIGRACTKHKFQKFKKNGLYVYAVREKTYGEVEANRSRSDTPDPSF